jgi:hypothetical protein
VEDVRSLEWKLEPGQDASSRRAGELLTRQGDKALAARCPKRVSG